MGDYQTILQELRDKLGKGTVSALIGTGFSKNVSNCFPSWNELLYDMVLELYGTEIASSFKNDCSSEEENEYKKAKVKEIISQEGALEIVSKYKKKKGYREAVEAYIEARIPYFDNNKLKIRHTNQVIQLEKKDFEVHSKLFLGNWNDIYTTNYDNLLEEVSKLDDKKWEVIKEAHQLSRENSHNIIKLHGDLCINDSDEFKFDNDFEKRYIISKEDYEDYPQKHEAFTQLMRVAFLKGSFCLIGFSGEDPNFKNWINWVRNILVQNNENKQSNKVYLVIPEKSSSLSRDKQLFYKNHHIAYIPLLDDEVKNIIGAGNLTCIKDVLSSFLDYLNESTPEIYIGSSQKYIKLWQEIFSETWHNRNGNSINSEKVSELYQLKKQNRLIKNSYFQENFLEMICKKTITENEVALILLALEDSFLLPCFYDGLEEKLNNAINDNFKGALDKILLREKILLNKLNDFSAFNAEDDDAIKYEKILSAAFSFNFQLLLKLLNDWQPSAYWIPKKTSLLIYFDSNARESLIEYIRTGSDLKEKYYAVDILNSIGGTEDTSSYRDKNIDGLTNIKDYILSQFNRKFDSFQPYGKRVIVYNAAESLNSRSAFQLFQFLIESGLPLCAVRYNIQVWDWYRIALYLFERYPYPVLFYSIQYYNEPNFFKRLGQDYIYSVDLTGEINSILVKLLKCYLSCNINQRNYVYHNILRIITEFLIAVKPKIWEQDFFTIWQERAVTRYERLDSDDEICYFIREGLRFIEDEKIICSIIISCLERANYNKLPTRDLLYILTQNQVFISKVAKLIVKDCAVKDAINQFIININCSQDFVIAGVINMLLTKQQTNKIIFKVREIFKDLSDLDTKNFYSVLYFAKNDSIALKQMKDFFLQSKYVWNSGIGDGWSHEPIFISYTRIKKIINWSEEEVLILYGKLKESLAPLVCSEVFGADPLNLFGGYSSLLNDMDSFLSSNCKILKQQQDFEVVKKQLHNLIVADREFKNISEALTSDTDKIVINGINQLINNIRREGIEKNKDAVRLAITRILLKKEAGLKACFEFISYLINSYKRKRFFEEELSLILKMYRGKTCQELGLNVPIIYKHIIQISDYLRNKGVESEDIDYWQNLRKTRRFNNL